MKIRNKIALSAMLMGITIIIMSSLFYYYFNKSRLIKDEQEHLVDISAGAAVEIEQSIVEIINTVKTLASTPLMIETVKKDNTFYSGFSQEALFEEIQELSDQWKASEVIEDPFVQKYMSNPLADYLNQQKRLIPNRYGEIFVTNIYGIAVATTNKLTTIEHAHKYWWIASYSDVQGKIFLDDRGYDPSADGYVLGIVLPIKDNGEIVGIIKANVNIQSILKDVIGKSEKIHQDTHIKLIRSKGLIVYEEGVDPLSESVSNEVVDSIGDDTISFYDSENGYVGAFSKVTISDGSETILFGGSYESIDHILGNLGEAWHIYSVKHQEDLYYELSSTTRELILIGSVLALIVAFIAMLLGNRIAKPITTLANVSYEIGEGNLEATSPIESKDEIGQLSNMLNWMAKKIRSTMDEKDKEVSRRIAAEEKSRYQSTHDYLTGLYNRRYLEGLLKIRDLSELYPVTFAIGDVNGLKTVNDTISHFAGDELLKTTAEVLENVLDRNDVLVRWGGDEFVLMLCQKDEKMASLILENVHIGRKEDYENIDVGIAFGWHTIYGPEDSWEYALSEAEIQMYQNKIASYSGGRRDIIDTILTAYHEKSPNEARHSTRVSKWCELIGNAMSFSKNDMARIKLAGLLHDIGKIGIRDELLLKEGTLTDEEREEIKQHPDIGYRILRESPSLRDVSQWIWCHHEHIDGTGYPRKIKGNEIPLFSRIISVADAYDAMTSYGSSKQKMTQEEAISELKRCAGTQFDKEIVAIFVEQVL